MLKLRWKLLLMSFVGALLLNAALSLVARHELLPVMADLETERVYKQLRLGRADLYGFVDDLSRVAKDYAAWDATYAFMASPSAVDIRSNMVARRFANQGLNFLVMLSPRGEMVYAADYDAGSGSLGRLGDGLRRDLLSDSRLWSVEDEGFSHAGFLQLDGRIYGLAAQPILTSAGQGPARGVLVVGRLLDRSALERFRVDWGYEVEMQIRTGELAPDAGEPSPLGHVYGAAVRDAETLSGYIHVQDIFERPLMDLAARFDRKFYSQGVMVLDTLLRWNLLICLIFALIVYLAIDRTLRLREVQRQADDKFHHLALEFKTILDGIPNPLMLISPERRVLWGNRAGAELLADISPEENGKYFFNVAFASGFAEGTSAVERCLESRKTERHEAEMADGREVVEYAYPLLGEQGELVSIIRLLVDVTEVARLKREANRNSRLASLGELAAGVAHEINNPTGMLLMNLSLLSDVFTDLEPILDDHHAQNPAFELGRIPYPLLRKKLPYLLTEMIEGGQRVKRMVEDLKGFARNGDGEEMQELDINEVAEAAQRLTAYQLKKATANFSFLRGEGLPAVRGHSRRLEQVVVNLLLNATQALESREQGITLRTRLSDDGREVVIEVEDQGRGIAAADIDKVTDPFFTTRRNAGGTGLGLSLSARIAEEHKGALDISSRPGAGSLIGLRLPCSTEEP